MQSIRRAVFLLCLLLPVASAQAGPAQDARAAAERGDRARAIKIVREAAEQGDAEAQASLGSMYVYGIGVPKDEALALDWYRKS